MRGKLVLFVLVNIICIHFSIAQDVKVLFVGDMVFQSHVQEMVSKQEDIFEYMNTFFKNQNIVIGNLETNVGTIGEPVENKVYCFQAKSNVIPVLKKHFSAVSIANNHTGDFGKEAFRQMLNFLHEQHLNYFGGGFSIHEAHQPLILSANGLRFAFIGFNQFFPRSFEAIGNQPGVAWGDIDQIRQDIQVARQNNVDYIFIYPHWGVEYEKSPTKKQIKFAHQLIDAGADAIIGAHPHVTQSIEIYKGKPIFYSLGNFLFPGFTEKECNTGWALQLSVNKNAIDWKIYEISINSNGIPSLSGKEISMTEVREYKL